MKNIRDFSDVMVSSVITFNYISYELNILIFGFTETLENFLIQKNLV